MAIPYGIYDVRANRGAVFIGKSHDTADFALDSIVAWWRAEGRIRYPNARKLVILADNGGSNGSTHHAWKYALQCKLADPFGLTLTVCHYPPATSKWNPIEHRLFAQISRNWAGEPLSSYETLVNFIRTTTTDTGLQVAATTLEGDYHTGVKIAKREMQQLTIQPHRVCPQWNYTVRPRPTPNGEEKPGPLRPCAHRGWRGGQPPATPARLKIGVFKKSKASATAHCPRHLLPFPTEALAA